MAVLLAVPILFFAWRFYWLRWSPARLIVSRETTYITEPLDSEGYPDYYAAINARTGQGVTPENNAFVLLLRAFGPPILPKNVDQRQLFGMLKIARLSKDRRYFEDWLDYGRRLPADQIPHLEGEDAGATDEDRLWSVEAEISERPWRRAEFPQAARWLDAQQEYLNLMVAASKRTRLYAPIVSLEDTPLLHHTFVAVDAERAAARALSTRALFRMGEQDFAGAWADLMAGQRLARLTAQGPMILDAWIGWIIAGDMPGNAVFLGTARLDPAQWAKVRAEFDALPPLPSATEKFDFGFRFDGLDTVLFGARRGIPALDELMYGNQKDRENPSPLESAVGGIDWNIPLRMINEWIDRYVQAANLEDPEDRSATIAALDAEAQSLWLSSSEDPPIIASIFSQRAASRHVGNMIVGRVLSSLGQAEAVEKRNAACQPLVRVGLALAHYQADNGAYPARLSDLEPRYLAAVPLDPYLERPFRYRKTVDGYRLYSIGYNGKDEAGRGPDDPNPGDDLLIEVPWKTKPKPAADEAKEPAGQSESP